MGGGGTGGGGAGGGGGSSGGTCADLAQCCSGLAPNLQAGCNSLVMTGMDAVCSQGLAGYRNAMLCR